MGDWILPLGVIVLQADLQLNCFGELALLLLRGVREQILDILSDVCDRYFTAKQLATVALNKARQGAGMGGIPHGDRVLSLAERSGFSAEKSGKSQSNRDF
jgi:hypothetical protein